MPRNGNHHQINEVKQKTVDLEQRLSQSLQQQAEVINQLINMTGKLEDENKYLKEQQDLMSSKVQELDILAHGQQ